MRLLQKPRLKPVALGRCFLVGFRFERTQMLYSNNRARVDESKPAKNLPGFTAETSLLEANRRFIPLMVAEPQISDMLLPRRSTLAAADRGQKG